MKNKKNRIPSDCFLKDIDSAISSLNKFRFSELGAVIAEDSFKRLMIIREDHIRDLKTKAT